jgi:molybdate transport system regulatory protein
MGNTLDGRFWISKSEHSFLGKGRIELLLFIEETGSITKAAKMMKMSYKAAWDAVDSMNNLSEFPLVQSSKGGKGGGGTHLTEYAKELIATYKVLSEEHQRFLETLSQRINQKNGHFRLLESMSVQMSARNQLKAKVSKIQNGAVESGIFLALQGGESIMATITNDSLATLNLTIGSEVYALFKANSVVIDRDVNLQKNDRNRFLGKVNRISRGSFDAEVIVAIKGGNTICSTMPIETLDELNLQEGAEVVAFCKPNTIILGIW